MEKLRFRKVKSFLKSTKIAINGAGIPIQAGFASELHFSFIMTPRAANTKAKRKK